MNKYELAVIVSAKIEDDERVATIEKVKSYIERFGGTITNVDEWGKKRLAYEIQKMKDAFYYFIQFYQTFFLRNILVDENSVQIFHIR